MQVNIGGVALSSNVPPPLHHAAWSSLVRNIMESEELLLLELEVRPLGRIHTSAITWFFLAIWSSKELSQ
jgi:hypothetical protein